MGGTMAHEYMAPSSAGEDRVARCSGCDYAANVEMAVSRIDRAPSPPSAAVAEVETPGVTTIEGLAGFLGVDARTTSKAMPVVADDGKVWLALVRGDRRLHELKLGKVLKQGTRAATPEEIEAAFGAKPGLDRPGRHPRGRDRRHRGRRDAARGRVGHRRQPHGLASHRRRGRRATTRRRSPTCTRSRPATRCPHCGGVLTIEPMIEIGNIFKLGTKYAEAMGATYLDELGAEQPIWMGSYGIGPGPHRGRRASSSPSTSTAASGRLRSRRSTSGSSPSATTRRRTPTGWPTELEERGLTCMVDDREGSPGVRFADADLIGAPAAGDGRQAHRQ